MTTPQELKPNWVQHIQRIMTDAARRGDPSAAASLACFNEIINNPVATIHVDGSFIHTEWHRARSDVLRLTVYALPERKP